MPLDLSFKTSIFSLQTCQIFLILSSACASFQGRNLFHHILDKGSPLPEEPPIILPKQFELIQKNTVPIALLHPAWHFT